MDSKPCSVQGKQDRVEDKGLKHPSHVRDHSLSEQVAQKVWPRLLGLEHVGKECRVHHLAELQKHHGREQYRGDAHHLVEDKEAGEVSPRVRKVVASGPHKQRERGKAKPRFQQQ